jgi:hypothetical protein
VGVEVIPADTTPEAAAVQLDIYRRMPPWRRLQIALELGDMVRELSVAGVRSRHPEYTDDQVRLAVIRLSVGENLFRKAYPGQDVQP